MREQWRHMPVTAAERTEEDIWEEKLKGLLLHVSELETNFRQNHLSLDTGHNVTKKNKLFALQNLRKLHTFKGNKESILW